MAFFLTLALYAQPSAINMANLTALNPPALIQQQQGRRRGQFPPGMFPGGAQGAAAPAAGAPAADIPGDDGPFAPSHCNKPSDWVVTHHKIVVNGQTISYTATAGFLPIKNRQGEVKANMFFVAYTKDDSDRFTRPVTFAFNGGPGSSSVWLHLGALGPKRAEMEYHGNLPASPYHLVDNQETWLPSTDVVMLDAVNTGFSRTTTAGDSEFYGKDGDLQAFTDGITQYMTWENRWRSPVFVAGESYGGFRVAGLSYSLLQAGVGVNGIISISGVMNMNSLDGGADNDLPYISFFPSECAVAWYHKKLSPDLQKLPVEDIVKKAEAFDMGPYAAALNQGFLSEEKQKQVAQEMSHLMGLSAQYIYRCNLRVPDQSFMAELLKDEGETTGRYDARIIGQLSTQNLNSQYPEYDASDAATSPVFTSCMNDYLRNDLEFKSNARYRIMAGVYPWDFAGDPDTSSDLRRALTQNPHMKVMFVCGYYDLACPLMGTHYVVNHMGLPRNLMDNMQFTYYPAGHMVYTDTPSRQELQTNIAKFIDANK